MITNAHTASHVSRRNRAFHKTGITPEPAEIRQKINARPDENPSAEVYNYI